MCVRCLILAIVMSAFSTARRRQRNNRSDFLADSAQREDLLDPDAIENLSNNEEVTNNTTKHFPCIFGTTGKIAADAFCAFSRSPLCNILRLLLLSSSCNMCKARKTAICRSNRHHSYFRNNFHKLLVPYTCTRLFELNFGRNVSREYGCL